MKLFAKECSHNNKELCEAIKKMNEQIKNNGGEFTFDFNVDEEGWFARCREFGGIMTGGRSKNPTEEEIMQSLIDAIKVAFHIPITKLEIKKEEEQCSLPTIKIVREFQFA
jgi:predicted RNase H-like HicB family nuclease